MSVTMSVTSDLLHCNGHPHVKRTGGYSYMEDLNTTILAIGSAKLNSWIHEHHATSPRTLAPPPCCVMCCSQNNSDIHIKQLLKPFEAQLSALSWHVLKHVQT
jgi:hypothetical protein